MSCHATPFRARKKKSRADQLRYLSSSFTDNVPSPAFTSAASLVDVKPSTKMLRMNELVNEWLLDDPDAKVSLVSFPSRVETRRSADRSLPRLSYSRSGQDTSISSPSTSNRKGTRASSECRSRIERASNASKLTAFLLLRYTGSTSQSKQNQALHTLFVPSYFLSFLGLPARIDSSSRRPVSKPNQHV